MNRPITSYPCAFSKHAATELSTPPLIASTTRCAMRPRFNPPPGVRPGEISGSRVGALGSCSLPEHPMAEDQPAASRSGIPDLWGAWVGDHPGLPGQFARVL